MHRNSSSTSSSDAAPRPSVAGALAALGSCLVCLLALDLAVGRMIGSPYGDPRAQAGPLVWYFNYGRSIEGKVRAMLGTEDAMSHPLARSGWIAPVGDQPKQAGANQDLLIAGYGMSFAANILQRMQDRDPRMALRFGGGPAATLSHSYAMYAADRSHHSANVVVLGILASSLPGLVTVSHMTWNFEAPSPHFYPRFSIANGRLTQYVPPVGSLAELRTVAQDASRWGALTAEIARHDAFYDPWVFRSGITDESVLARLARRGWGQRSKRDTIGRFHSNGGFTNELGLLDIARGLVEDFIAQVENEGRLAVILAINDRGYADHLHQILAPIVADGKAVYLSTHELAPASDARNFLKDGHFVPQKTELIARELARRINSRLNRQPALQ